MERGITNNLTNVSLHDISRLEQETIVADIQDDLEMKNNRIWKDNQRGNIDTTHDVDPEQH